MGTKDEKKDLSPVMCIVAPLSRIMRQMSDVEGEFLLAYLAMILVVL